MISAREPPKRPSEPTAWTADLSQVDLRIDDSPEPHGRGRDETGPLPAASESGTRPMGDGTKIAVGTGSTLAVLALVDKALSSTGLTATEVVQHLGPALGVLYNSSPMLVGMFVLAWVVSRGYRTEQAAHRRRDRRLQKALVEVVQVIGRLRSDVSSIETVLAGVRTDAEAKIVAAALAAATRSDRIDKDIADLQRNHARLDVRLGSVESKIAEVDAPALPRRQSRGKPT